MPFVFLSSRRTRPRRHTLLHWRVCKLEGRRWDRPSNPSCSIATLCLWGRRPRFYWVVAQAENSSRKAGQDLFGGYSVMNMGKLNLVATAAAMTLSFLLTMNTANAGVIYSENFSSGTD